MPLKYITHITQCEHIPLSRPKRPLEGLSAPQRQKTNNELDLDLDHLR